MSGAEPADETEVVPIRMGSREWTRLVVQIIIIGVLAVALVQALELRELARYFPVFAASLGIVAGIFGIITDQIRYRRGIPAPQPSIGEATLFVPVQASRWTEAPFVRALRYIGWLLLIGLLLSQFTIAQVAPFFVAAFMLIEARVAWWRAPIYGGAAWLLVWFLSVQIGLPTP